MKKVMIFGTFDILHKGHINFFKQAKKLGDKLTIVVARDKTVKKIKGSKPVNNERARQQSIKLTNIADKVALGKLKDYYHVIRREKPDIIALGYDQVFFTKRLKKLFPQVIIKKLKAYKPTIYKSSKLKLLKSYVRHQSNTRKQGGY